MSQENKKYQNGHILQRADIKANWEKSPTILLKNEVAYETDTGRYKIGDGLHTWIELNYPEWDAQQQEIDLSNYYTKSEVDNEHSQINTDINGIKDEVFGINVRLVNKAEVDVVDKKADKATTLAGYGITDAVGRAVGSGEIFNDYSGANEASGYKSHAEGSFSRARGDFSHVEGVNNSAEGEASHSEGESTKAIGNYSHTEGHYTQTNGESSHAEGYGTKTFGDNSHAEGYYTQTNSENSHAEGFQTKTFGNNSHAEGDYTVAGKQDDGYSIIYMGMQDIEIRILLADMYYGEDQDQKAKNRYSVGDKISLNLNGTTYNNIATINRITVELDSTTLYTTFFPEVSLFDASNNNRLYVLTIQGDATHAEGSHTVATEKCQHVQGKYNYLDENGRAGNYAHIVGNGENENQRSNAHTLDWNGNAWFAGGISVGADRKKLVNEDEIDGLVQHKADKATTIEGYGITNAVGKINNKKQAEIFNDYVNNQANGNYSHAEGYYTQAGIKGYKIVYAATSTDGTYIILQDNHLEQSQKAYEHYIAGQKINIKTKKQHLIEIAEIISVEAYSGETRIYTTSFDHSGLELGGNEWLYVLEASFGETLNFGQSSHAEGTHTIALGDNSHVQGKYNIVDNNEQYAHIVGNGSDEEHRSNAHTLDWNGNAWFAGDITVGPEKKRLITQDDIATNSDIPINKVKVNNTKTIVLPNLKGGLPLKKLSIGNKNEAAMYSSRKIPVTLKSKSLINLLDLYKWVPRFYVHTTSSKRRATYIDITEHTISNNVPNVLWLTIELINPSVTPADCRILAIKKDTLNDAAGSTTVNLTSKFKSNLADLSTLNKIKLDFSLVQEYLNDEYIIAFSCYNQSFVSTSNVLDIQYEFFDLWLSRFKYFQLETGETASTYNLGLTSAPCTGKTVTVNGLSWSNNYISEAELKQLYLENSGTAELIIETGDYPAPSDVYVEYYEDPTLKQEKMTSDLMNLIATNTAAIIANGGSEQ